MPGAQVRERLVLKSKLALLERAAEVANQTPMLPSARARRARPARRKPGIASSKMISPETTSAMSSRRALAAMLLVIGA